MLSFGLSQFHGHGSWLVCEVALSLRLLYHSTHSCNPRAWCFMDDRMSVASVSIEGISYYS